MGNINWFRLQCEFKITTFCERTEINILLKLLQAIGLKFTFSYQKECAATVINFNFDFNHYGKRKL